MSEREDEHQSDNDNDNDNEQYDNDNNNNRIKFRNNTNNSNSGNNNGGGKRRRQQQQHEEDGETSRNKKRKIDYRREFFNSLDAETKRSLIPLTNEDEKFAQLNEKDDLQAKLDFIHKIAKSQQEGIQRLERRENKRTIKQAGRAKTYELYKALKKGLDGDLKYERKIENMVDSYRTYELLKSFAIEQLSRASVTSTTDGGDGDGNGDRDNDNNDDELNEEELENQKLYENLYTLTKKEHRKLNDNERKKLNKFLQTNAKQIMEQSNLGRWSA